MNNYLKFRDIISLSFMTFAFFVGAGNIIFPPMLGLQAGKYIWIASIGFLVTAVWLPVLSIIALAKSDGGIDNLSNPIGKTPGMLLAVICYLIVGPLFAIPRTATVSFEIGIAPLTKYNNTLFLFLYSFFYFAIVILIALYPGKLINTIGNFLAPLKIIALFMLAIVAVNQSSNPIKDALDPYKSSAFFKGFLNGYLTMDTLGAMVFGIVIINALRNRGIKEVRLLTRYTIYVSIIAGVGLMLLYLSFFRLGANSAAFIVDQRANGAIILRAYIQNAFGNKGILLLAILIFLSCLVTSIGLISACAEFFSKKLSFSYHVMVFVLGGLSMIVSNLGLNYLIKVSIPILMIIYPPCIVLVLLSFTHSWWNNSSKVIVLAMFTSLIFDILDEIKGTKFSNILLTTFMKYLPFSEQGLSWLIPTLIMLLFSVLWDYITRKRQLTLGIY